MSDRNTDAARQRVALAQHALLSALVADSPAPPGFDRDRLRAQRRALLTKRTHVVAKVAPDLPRILGEDFAGLFAAYARSRPMTDGYHRDALDFAGHLLDGGALTDPARRRSLAGWLADRTPSARGPLRRLVPALRARRLARRTKGK